MTVKDLIEQLEQSNPESNVCFSDNSFCIALTLAKIIITHDPNGETDIIFTH